jgi:hypothetical protein
VEQAAYGIEKENGPRGGGGGKGAVPRERKGAGRAGLPGLFSYSLGFLTLFYFFSWFSTSNLFGFKSNLNSSPMHSTK